MRWILTTSPFYAEFLVYGVSQLGQHPLDMCVTRELPDWL